MPDTTATVPASPEGPRPACSVCGPGYRIGDDGCRHGFPRSPEGPDEALRETVAAVVFAGLHDGMNADAIAATILRLPLLTAERERADKAEKRRHNAHREMQRARAEVKRKEEHLARTQTERNEARERADRLAQAVEKAQAACASLADWTPMESRDAGSVFPSDSVYDLVADINAELALSATDKGPTCEAHGCDQPRVADSLLCAWHDHNGEPDPFLSATDTGEQKP